MSGESNPNESWIVVARESKAIFNESRELLVKKNQAYGPNNINEIGFAGVVSRMTDKFARLNNLIYQNTMEANDESIEDTLFDIANYSCIALMKRRGTWPRSSPVRSPSPEKSGEVMQDVDPVSSPPARAQTSSKFGAVYLAGPIEMTEDGGHGWRDEVIKSCPSVLFVDPTRMFGNALRCSEQDFLRVRDVDLAVLQGCDTLLVNLLPCKFSYGTVVEMEEWVRLSAYGAHKNRQMIVVSPTSVLSAHFNPKGTSALCIVSTLEEAIGLLNW